MTEASLHLRGVVLDADGERHADLWVTTDGLLSHEPVPGADSVADGGWILPGFVDAHCHVGLGPHGAVDLETARTQGHTVAASGTTLVRDCGSPIDTRPLDDDPAMPEIVRAGRHLARPKRYIRDLPIEAGHPDELPGLVAEQAAANPWVKLVGDWIDREAGDLTPLWPDDVLVEAIATAHAHGARVTAHVFGEDALPGLIAAGIDCLEHGTGLGDDTVAAMVAGDVALVPTMINVENFPSFAEAAGERFPRYGAHMRDLHARADRTVGAALDAGVRIYAGTDAGGGISHGRLADEVAALHRIGMTPQAALGAACWDARTWLGRPGLEHGAPADLVVYDRDPRTDLGVLRHPRVVVRAGAVL